MYDLKWVMTSAATCLQRSERPYLTDRYRHSSQFLSFCFFLMFESFSFLFPFFFPRLVSDHFLVISVCLFVALAHVSVCWVCFLSVWFTLGGLCNFFGQCILCLTCFFFAHFGKSANTLPRSLHESGSFRNTWSCIFSAYCLTPWSFLQLTVNAE